MRARAARTPPVRAALPLRARCETGAVSQSSGAAAAPSPGGSAGPAGPPARRRGGGTAADMVRSLLVIGVLVAVVVLAVPRPQGRIEQPVDVAAATEQARELDLDVRVPAVPEGWRPNVASFEPDPVEGLPTWSVGYLVPEDAYAGVRVTRGATPAWVDGMTGQGRPPQDGETEREVAGATWQVVVSDQGARRRSLVLVDDQQTTVVTGTAPDADLEALAAAVAPPPSA